MCAVIWFDYLVVFVVVFVAVAVVGGARQRSDVSGL